jgi:hypothetical protein
MSLEEAVHRLTGRTAQMHDTHDRGCHRGHGGGSGIFDPIRRTEAARAGE